MLIVVKFQGPPIQHMRASDGNVVPIVFDWTVERQSIARVILS